MTRPCWRLARMLPFPSIRSVALQMPVTATTAEETLPSMIRSAAATSSAWASGVTGSRP